MPDSPFPMVAPTNEAAWLQWAATLPELALDAGRVIVVAPHPDDETLGCGGLIADLCTRGVDVLVVAVTDGEGSHPGHDTLPLRRRAEQEHALRTLGVRHHAVRLGLRDSAVDADREMLHRRFEELVRADDVLVAPWPQDGHCDHDACGAVAGDVAAATGCHLLGYPVWAWQWARPADLDGFDWRRRSMTGTARAAKLGAIGRYRTQTTEELGEVIVNDAMLVRFRRPFEVFANVR